MRPLMVAEPMFLAVRPEMVPESYFTRWFAPDCGDRTQVEPSTSTRPLQLAKREQGIDMIDLFLSFFFSSGLFRGWFGWCCGH